MPYFPATPATRNFLLLVTGAMTFFILMDTSSSWWWSIQSNRSVNLGFALLQNLIIFYAWPLLALGTLVALRRFLRNFSLRHWYYHGITSLLVSVTHLGLVTTVNWLAKPWLAASRTFLEQYSFEFFQWFAYELLAYWAFLGLYFLVRENRNAHPLLTPSAKLVVKTADSVQFIPLAKIDWLEAQENYVRVHSQAGEYMIRTTMKHLEASLLGTSLVRCHRSAIVNVDNIAKMKFSRQRRELTTNGGDTLAVSAAGQKKLLEKTGALAQFHHG